jgi:SSS family solute:Na+ symporter
MGTILNLDMAIVIALVVFLFILSFRTIKYNRSVADFLAANRCAGRYILGIGDAAAFTGAITIILGFQMFYKVGFAPQYWGVFGGMVSLIVTLSGWITYRFRRTRALTMGQFLESRYSRKFRIFAGGTAWVAGIINFGIFPQIGARFFLQYFGLPIDTPHMAVAICFLLGLALFFTFTGGQISVIITDFWQGIITLFGFGAIIIYLLLKYKWGVIATSMIAASKPGESLVNPMDIGESPFNIYFFLIYAFILFYQFRVWQGNQGYYCAARTAHEAKMGGVVSTMRGYLVNMGIWVIPIAVFVVLKNPEYSGGLAENIDAILTKNYGDNEFLRTSMIVPVTLSKILPRGLMGLFAACMMGFAISTLNTYMHSWGSIFIQDVVMPLRKTPFTPKRHMLYLRLSILFVAVFAGVFSLLFPLMDYIRMFFEITGAIFTGGAGAAIIGGLYWKRGTTPAAWAGMIVGSVSSVSAIVLQLIWNKVPFFTTHIAEAFPNMMYVTLGCMVAAIMTYVVVSLLTCRGKFVNMDRLLHRGKYTVAEEEAEYETEAVKLRKIRWYWRLIGVNSKEFSKVDKGLFAFMFSWTFIWTFGSFLVLLYLATATDFMTDKRWMTWWGITILVNLIAGAVFAVWIAIGGLKDIYAMNQHLKTMVRNELDDGRVVDGHNLADEVQDDVE